MLHYNNILLFQGIQCPDMQNLNLVIKKNAHFHDDKVNALL